MEQLVELQRFNAHDGVRSEEHTSELQSHVNLVCRLLLEKKKKINNEQCLQNIALACIFPRQNNSYTPLHLRPLASCTLPTRLCVHLTRLIRIHIHLTIQT